MIHFILGNDDTQKKNYLASHRLKNYAEVNFNFFDSLDFDRESFEQSIRGSSLWEDRADGYVLLDMLSNEEGRNFFSSVLTDGTNTPIYFVDSKVPSEEYLEQFKEKDIKIFKKESERPDFTLFGAVYARDKKTAWVSYVQKIQKEPIELVYANVLSQFKNMSKVSGGHKDLDFKSLGFSTQGGYSSAQRGAQKYTETEIQEMYQCLVVLPTVSRAEGAGLELALEQFILEKL